MGHSHLKQWCRGGPLKVGWSGIAIFTSRDWREDFNTQNLSHSSIMQNLFEEENEVEMAEKVENFLTISF
jgi:hypothetical protein